MRSRQAAETEKERYTKVRWWLAVLMGLIYLAQFWTPWLLWVAITLAVGGLRGPGHRVILPPEDYDSRILGYAIARLEPRNPETQAQELDALWRVEMAP